MDVWSVHRSRAWLVGALVAVLVGACATQVDVQTTTAGAGPTSPPDEVVTPDDTTAPPSSTPVDATDTGTDPDADPTPAESDAAVQPLHVPASGEPVAVVGVAFDDTVPLRAAPDAGAEITAELSARFDGVIGAGQGQINDGTAWWRVRVGGTQGWVDASTMARLGATADVTADVVAGLGERPRAATMRALGRTVARTRLEGATDAADGRVVVSAPPEVGDVGEITFDIVDRADDSVAGERLVVVGTPDGDGFVLRSVEATVFCARGVTGDGRCT